MQHFQRHDLSKVLVNTLLPLYTYKTNCYITHKATVYHTTETRYTPTQTRKLDLCTVPSTLQTMPPRSSSLGAANVASHTNCVKLNRCMAQFPLHYYYFFFWHAILLLKRAGKQLGLQASSFWTQVTQKRKKFPPRRGLCKDVDTSKSILWTFVAFDIYVAIQLCASDVRRDFVATSTKVTHRCKKKKKMTKKHPTIKHPNSILQAN